MKSVFNRKALVSSVCGVAVAGLMSVTSIAVADNENNLPAQDALVTTIIDKSIISGEIRKDVNGNMVPDANGMLSFDYTGDVYSVDTNEATGELEKLKQQIGTISGTAAFPTDFAYLSATR